MLIVWTTQNDAKLLEEAIKKPAKKWNIPLKVKITEKLVQSKDHPVLALGKLPLELLQKEGALPKNRKIGSMRAKLHDTVLGKYFISFDPSVKYLDYAWWINLKMDLDLACRFVKTGNISPVMGKYTEVPNFKELCKKAMYQYKQTGKPVEMSVDLETMGLDPYKPGSHIVSVHASMKKGTGYCMYVNNQKGKLTDTQRFWLGKLLNYDWVRVEGANFKFDIMWLWVQWKMNCTNFTFDTHLCGSMLNENISNSLNTHAKIYTTLGGYDDVFNATYDKDHMEIIPKESIIQYGGGDVDACFRVGKVFRKTLKKNPKLTKFYAKILHPACRVFEEIEKAGIFIDINVYTELRKSLTTSISKDKKAVWKLLPNKLKEKHCKEVDWNPKKPSLIKDYLFGFYDNGKPMGLGVKPKMYTPKAKEETWKYASTAGNHLLMMRGYKKARPYLDAIETYGSTAKTLQTYVDGFLKHLRSDGRYHPSYFLFKGSYTGDDDQVGTNTGRTSVRDPALQTLPKRTKWAKPLRKAFIAPKGYKILGVDYSEGELRIVADRSGDKVMIDAYNAGVGLHATTAAALNDIPVDEFLALKKSDFEKYDFMRFGAKAGNFGLVYGMQVSGFQTYCRDQYALNYSLKECGDRRDKFFNLYPGLEPWHIREVRHAHMKGFVENPLGRVRHLPMMKSKFWDVQSKEERRAINAPVQACLNDLLFYSLVKFKEKYDKYMKARDVVPCMTVHDSIYFYVRENQAEDWAAKVVKTMSTLPLKKEFGWSPKVEFTADAEIGYNLAEMKELSF